MIALLVGLCCFVAHVAVTLVWLRVRRGPSPVARHAVSALSAHILGVIAAANLVGPFAYWPVAAVSGFGAVCWLFAFSAVYKSVSLRILTQLNRTPENTLTFEAITQDYVRPEFEARVAVLMKMNCANEVDGCYTATETGNATARRIGVIQRACGIDGSGLYSDSASGASYGTGESPQPVP
ncbi:MAG: hypothetical protein C0467_18360 [Planctomycetaceae bacterium]|nr:hypothetical protein [Planctomycetaceae bacterium]